MTENPTLQGFVFFTNVDLTPNQIEQLKEIASSRGISIIDIFDMERLRHALDSPEGLIARLQYLDIPMSTTEQIALVSKFGNQLQNAVLTRFDRVEQTLSQMERFLEFQKPLYRLDIYLALNTNCTSSQLGDEALILEINGLHDKNTFCLCTNLEKHASSSARLVMRAHLWLEDQKEKVISFIPSLGLTSSTMTAYCELCLRTGGQRVRIADLSNLTLNAYFTPNLLSLASRITIDANGYELFNCQVTANDATVEVDIPETAPCAAKGKTWINGVMRASRDLMSQPPNPSGRPLLIEHINFSIQD